MYICTDGGCLSLLFFARVMGTGATSASPVLSSTSRGTERLTGGSLSGENEIGEKVERSTTAGSSLACDSLRLSVSLLAEVQRRWECDSDDDTLATLYISVIFFCESGRAPARPSQRAVRKNLYAPRARKLWGLNLHGGQMAVPFRWFS